MPTRAPVAPPQPTPGMWTPDMGIKFGGAPGSAAAAAAAPTVANAHNPAYPNTKIGGQAWNPNLGVRFG